MDIKTIIQILLFGLALAMDAFAVSITDGLVYEDINKKKSIFIATVFGVMQALMPLIGFFAIELVTFVVGESGGQQAGHILSIVITWVAFSLLLLIGGKMLLEGIKGLRRKEDFTPKKFSIKEVLFMGVATAIDALAVGVSLHAEISTPVTIWLHVSIILVITFILSLVGLLLGGVINKLLKGKYEVTEVIGGTVLILLAVWIVLSHYVPGLGL